MQATQKKHDGLSYEYEIKIPASELDTKRDQKLMNYAPQINIQGFRRGKVPLKLLQQRFGKQVLGEVIEEAVQESTQKLLAENNIRPAMQPKIDIDQDYAEGKDLTYKIAIESLPEFKIMDLQKVKVEKPVAEVDEKAIDEALEKIAANRRSTKPIEAKRGAKEGDILKIDFHGRTADDNVEQPGMHAHGHMLELGSNSFIPGFEDQLKGKKAGEKIEVKVTFPEDYHAENLKGREAIFDVDLEEIHEATETKIDDEFATSLGLENVEALRNAVKEQLQGEYENQSRLKVKKAILDVLDEEHDFDVPEGMIKMENEQIMRQIEMEKQQSGSTEEISQEEKDELADIAVRRVKLGLILADIGRNNNIQVSDAELQQAVIKEAQKYPGQEKEVFDYFSKNQNALESLRAPLFEEKTIDYIVELAEVTEKKVSVDALSMDEEEDAPKKEKKSSAKKSSSTAKKKEPAKKAGTKKDDKPKAEKKEPAKKPAAKKKTAAKK